MTLVFTDIEGSTRLLSELGPDAYQRALAEHRRIVRAAFGRHDGYEVDNEGDSFFYAFAAAADAVRAAGEALVALAGGPILIRVGIHTGSPRLDPPKYVGLDVHKAARIMSAAHGGQVLVSDATRELLAGPFGLEELGEHRLKDFDHPVCLYQLGTETFPPLRTLSVSNLPAPVSTFVGRGSETDDARKLLSGTRLLTITGPGGAGKTRFAIELVSGQLERFPNGAFWVPLSTVVEPELVLEHARQVLGAGGDLAAHIGDKRLLLLFDNFEQLVDGAAGLAELLEACPRLVVVVTSRELLRVRGETAYELPPLTQDEAVALFCERARTAPQATITEICERLDGLPLAIELAAARLRHLAPEQLLARLSQRLDLLQGERGADPRQQTLRATIGWSYDLLDPGEQALFARLSVFSGGCTLEAAEDIAEGDLDTLASLLDKSLLRLTDGRYWMFETIREYARETLATRPDAEELLDRHAHWFAAQLSERNLAVRDQEPRAVAFVTAELDNARAALLCSVDRGSGSDAALVLWGTFSAWLMAGRALEGARCADAVLAADLSTTPLERVALLTATGELLRFAGDAGQARELKQGALEAAGPLVGQALPGGRTVTSLLVALRCDLADIAQTQGDLTAALALSDSALSDARDEGDPRTLSRALGTASVIALTGDPEAAIALAQEALGLDLDAGRLLDATEDRVLMTLGLLQLGDARGAATILQTAIDDIRDHPGRAFSLVSVLGAASRLALALERPDDAIALFHMSVWLADKHGVALDTPISRALSEVREAAPTITNEPATSEPALSEDDALELAATVADEAHALRRG